MSKEKLVDQIVLSGDKRARGKCKPTGAVHEHHKTAWEGLKPALEKLFPGERFRPEIILEHACRMAFMGDMSDYERSQVLLSLMKFLYPTLKAVDHTGEVKNVTVNLTHKDIQNILKNDPFLEAKEVKPE